MKFYPIFLDISKRRCVVVGGGEVAQRKVERLLDSGAEVSVVSRELTPGLEDLKAQGRIEHVNGRYRKSALRGAVLVIGATDDGLVNKQIRDDAAKIGIIVNIVDDPGLCDFILPAVVDKGDLIFAVSTSGKSPALARRLREEIEYRYGPEYRMLASIMGALRDRVLAKNYPPDMNRGIFESVLDSGIIRHLREGNFERARALIRDLAGEDIEIERFKPEKTPEGCE